ncbi:hypothetical protein McanMca71_005580 [Microsporum canis]
MRLHLIIHRHELPVTRLLWSTPVTQNSGLPLSRQPSALSSFTSSGPASVRTLSASASFNTAYTSTGAAGGGNDANYIISQLLADVNEVVPLGAAVSTGDAAHDNSEHWFLHDYVVEVMNSECLHFMRVDALLREGDEVVIRPLDPEDIATRIATGRRQIAANGTYLIDGVPFGKSRQDLKRTTVSRPSINIPPRNKRRRLETGDWSHGGGLEATLPLNDTTVVIEDVAARREDVVRSEEPPTTQAQAVTETQEEEATAGDEEKCLSTVAGGVPVEPPVIEMESVIASTPNVKRRKTPHLTPEKVQLPGPEDKSHLEEPSNKCSSEEESSSSDEDDSGNDSSSDSDSDSHSNSDSEPDSNYDSSSDISSSSDSTSSDSDSDSDSSPGSSPKVPSSNNKPSELETNKKNSTEKGQVNPPGHGTVRTKRSNLRAKWRRRLLRLKIAGILDKDANFDDMRAWENGKGGSAAIDSMLEVITSKEKSDFEKKREQLLRDIAEGGVEIPSPSSEKRKHQVVSQAVEVDSIHTSTPAQDKASPLSNSTASTRQSKLDIASTRRLLFGSLGVKPPKTKEEEEQTRNKLAQKYSLTPKVTAKKPRCITSEPSKEVIQPVENWQDRIVLKATECVYDDIELSTPPFPFVQRWDADAHAVIQELRASQAPQSKKRKKNKHKRQSCSNSANEKLYAEGYNQNYDYINEDVTLDYGDEASEPMEDVSHIAGVHPEAKPHNNGPIPGLKDFKAQDKIEPADDDLPPLPTDISTLPNADKSNLWPGAIFAFKQLDLSKATNWQPQVSPYRTAIVENITSSDIITFRLAKRDRDVLETDEADENNPRSYTKFEMPGFDEVDEEDDGLRDLEIHNLIDAKLVSAAARVSANKPREQLADIEEDPVKLREEEGLEDLADEPTDLGNEVAETQNVRLTEQAPLLTSSPPGDIHVSSPSRREISQLIRDAGFRSSVNSELAAPNNDEVVRDSGPNLEENKQDDTEETIQERSSGGEAAVQENGPLPQENEQHDVGESLREKSPFIASPKFTGFDYIPSPEASAEAPAESEPRKSPSPPLDSTVPETKLSPLSALENWISANTSTHGSDRENAPQPPNNFNEPDLSDDDSDSNTNSLVPNPFYEIDHLSDNDPDPTIEDLLAESTPCPPKTLKPLSNYQPAGSTSPPPKDSPHMKTQHPATKSTSPPSHEDNFPTAEVHDRNEDSQPSASQIPEGSVVVDLTLSSDPAADDEDFEEDSSLFHGPGWVAKRKPKPKLKPKANKRGRGGRHGRSQRRGRRSILEINRSIV